MMTRRSTLALLVTLLLLCALVPGLIGARPAPLGAATTLYLPFIGQSASLVFSSNRESGSAIRSLRADGRAGSTISGPATNDWHPALSPDGRLIAFFSSREGFNAAYVMGRDGANQRKLVGCNICIDIAWSPDSQRFLVTQQELAGFGSTTRFAALVQVDGGPAPQRTYEPYALWSPGGERVAFIGEVGGKPALLAEAPDTGQRTTLALGPVVAGSLAWSPDGRQIVYTMWEHSDYTISVAQSDGSGARRLASGLYPAWSPDSTRLAFLSYPGGSSPGVLSLMGANGRGRRDVGSVGTFGAPPVWSPDGTQIAVVTWIGSGSTSTLYIAGAQGGLTATALPLQIPGRPLWSPDGANILVSATYSLSETSTEHDAQIVVVGRGGGAVTTAGTGRLASWLPDGTILAAVDIVVPTALFFAYEGGEPRRLGVGDLPALSPDGRQVAYVRGDELRLIGTDGRGDQLLAGGLAIGHQPAWSPDGALIALISDGALSLIGADGKGLRRITQLVAHGAPAWSPDGTRLAFSADGVYVTDLAGAAPRKVADGVAPVWSPDGATIAYLKSDTSAAPELWLVPADGGAPRMLWSCQAGPRVLGNCRLDDARWAGDGRLISLVESGIVAGKAFYRGVVALNADSGADVFSSSGDWSFPSDGQGSAPRWVSGSDRLAYIHPERYGFYIIGGIYELSESYAKLCVVSLPAAGCAGIPAGHGDVLSYDVGQ